MRSCSPRAFYVFDESFGIRRTFEILIVFEPVHHGIAWVTFSANKGSSPWSVDAYLSVPLTLGATKPDVHPREGHIHMGTVVYVLVLQLVRLSRVPSS